MMERTWKRIVSKEQRGVAACIVRWLLQGLSIGYGTITALRNHAFDVGWKSTTPVEVPVIAIGNLTTGGTGKTPVVAMVVNLLRDQGLRPGIVSRGYRADATGANDEKRVLEYLCPEVPHVQQADRIQAAEQLIRDHGVGVVVLDDAFQHRRIHRDLNIVLIDATVPFGYGHQLPAGLLRESLRGLCRADVVLITRADHVSSDRLREIEATICRYNPDLGQRIHRVTFQPTELLAQDRSRHELAGVEQQAAMLLSAIGNPDAFQATCESFDADIVASRFFPDHHHYTTEDLNQVQQQAERKGATVILTTLKDLVKIPPGHDNIRAVLIETKFVADPGQQQFHQQIIDIGSQSRSGESI